MDYPLKWPIALLALATSSFAASEETPLYPAKARAAAISARLTYRSALDYNDGGFNRVGQRSANTSVATDFVDGELNVETASAAFRLKYDLRRRAFYWAYAEGWLGATRYRAGFNLTHEGGYDNQHLSFMTLLSSPYTLQASPVGGVAPMVEVAWPDFELGDISLQIVNDVPANNGARPGYFSSVRSQPAWICRWQFQIGYVKPSVVLGVYDTSQSNFKVLSLAYLRSFMSVYADYVYDLRASEDDFGAGARIVTAFSSRNIELNLTLVPELLVRGKYVIYSQAADGTAEDSNPAASGALTSLANNMTGWALGAFWQPGSPLGGFIGTTYRAGIFREDSSELPLRKNRLSERRYLLGVVGTL